MDTEKHAFLIAAHNQIELLKVLLSLLDDPRNDIYLHVDSRCADYDANDILPCVKKSKVFFIERRRVSWGGYSQIQLEFDLLRAAVKGQYLYYHLISGVDLPIKNQDYIHLFFNQNSGKEFVSFDYDQDVEKFKYRFDLYHFFQERYANKKTFLYKVDRFLQRLQRLLGIHRIKSIPCEIKKGANWFSITHDLATYVLEKESFCKKTFKHTRCCDEIFLQTLVYNSEFNNRLYYSEAAKRFYNMRYVDFQRGNPYVFRIDDYDDLTTRSELFARKFDLSVDQGIVKRIENKLLKENSDE